MSHLIRSVASRGIPHQPAAPTLALENVTVAYAPGAGSVAARGPGNGRIPAAGAALEDITLRVEAGQRVAVVGPNGAGKSTLFKVIVGAIKPTHGRVDVYGGAPDQHICIAYVPQRSGIDWTFPVTVADVVMMGRAGQIGLLRRPGRRDRAIVAASLERVGATALADKQIGELSGGQQQRVFLARALAQEADLILLDEPLAGLDLPSRETLFDILDNLRDGRVTILVATHDLNVAADYFDRIVLLNRRVIAFGPPAAVLTTENLVAAYGGHLRVVGDADSQLLLTDTCCDQGEHEGVPG